MSAWALIAGFSAADKAAFEHAMPMPTRRDQASGLALWQQFPIVPSMGRLARIYIKLLSGTADAHMPFADLRRLLLHFGFHERIRGSHHIYTREDVEEIINLQPKGRMAKPYQVKQVRQLLTRHGIGGVDEDPV